LFLEKCKGWNMNQALPQSVPSSPGANAVAINIYSPTASPFGAGTATSGQQSYSPTGYGIPGYMQPGGIQPVYSPPYPYPAPYNYLVNQWQQQNQYGGAPGVQTTGAGNVPAGAPVNTAMSPSSATPVPLKEPQTEGKTPPNEEQKQQPAEQPKDAKAEEKPAEAKKDDKTTKVPDSSKMIVPLTDEYIQKLEKMLNDTDYTVRAQGIKEVLKRFKEDETRKSDKALTALLNKALQDPDQAVKSLAIMIPEAGYAVGDNLTVQLLENIKKQESKYINVNQEAARRALDRIKDEKAKLAATNAQPAGLPQVQPNANNLQQAQSPQQNTLQQAAGTIPNTQNPNEASQIKDKSETPVVGKNLNIVSQ